MNETLKVLETRRSCRNFDRERMVSEEDIQAIVKAGTYAATGMGRQSPIIIAVTNKELRDRLSAENAKIMGTATDPFYGAPVILIVLADKDIWWMNRKRKSLTCSFHIKKKRKCRDRFFKIGYNIAKEIKHNKNIFHLPRQNPCFCLKWLKIKAFRE